MYDKPFVTWHYSLGVKWPGSFIDTVSRQPGESQHLLLVWKVLLIRLTDPLLEEINSHTKVPFRVVIILIFDDSSNHHQRNKPLFVFQILHLFWTWFIIFQLKKSSRFCFITTIKECWFQSMWLLQTLIQYWLPSSIIKITFQLNSLVKYLSLIFIKNTGVTNNIFNWKLSDVKVLMYSAIVCCL